MQGGPVPDTALVEAGRRGDHAAFAQLVERYQDAVYAVSYATTRDRALADDVTQDTFVAAWRGFGALRDSTRLPAWLCGIARNRARDALKRRRWREDPDAAVPDIADPSTPFDALSDAQAEHLVATALYAVPAVYREPLVLFYIEQRPVADVARMLGLDPRTTNKRLSRGRQQLAARVGELVERKLSVRGPRRDLAACVVAAIGALGSASHVDASPAVTKGSIMPKLALATLVVATVGGASLLSAGVATTQPPPAPRKPATTAAAAPAAQTPPRPSPTAKPPASPAIPRQLPATRPQLSIAPSSVPDCATVARHLAEVQFEGFSAKVASLRDEFVRRRSADYATQCVAERWSDDRRLCSISATDLDDVFVCRQDKIGTAEELANLRPEHLCDAVAQHVAELATAPGGMFDIVVPQMASAGFPFDPTQVTEQVRDQTRAKCERIPWSLSHRRCLAASRTHHDTYKCR